MEWAGRGVRKEDYVRPRLQRMERQGRFGVYFILRGMEVGPGVRIAMPKYPTADPDYRIVSSQRSRYGHYYFYIRDEVMGPMALCVGSFLPFSITYYLNLNSEVQVQQSERHGGYRVMHGLPRWVRNPGFYYQGISGIGYQLLRLARPKNLPVLLLWE